MQKGSLISTILVILISSISFTSNAQDIWEVPQEAKTMVNPNQPSKKSLKNAEAMYKMRCVICHGEVGKGDGIGATALNPKPADHTSEELQSQTDGELFWKISNGRGAMIGWGNGDNPMISTSDRWDLVNYIRTLKGK